jgi:hypothetical protein
MLPSVILSAEKSPENDSIELKRLEEIRNKIISESLEFKSQLAKLDGEKEEDYEPPEEDIEAIANELFDWPRRDLLIKILQFEFWQDLDAKRISLLQLTVQSYEEWEAGITRVIDDMKYAHAREIRIFKRKAVKAGFIGGGIMTVITPIAIILVRLAIQGKLN